MPPEPPPTIRPPTGGVATGGSASDVERDGLLRVLAKGPDFQTAAAAKGLAVSWADTKDPLVLDALIGVLRRDSTSREARAEAWIAFLKILGDPLSWDDEAAARRAFPEGVDWDRVDSVDADLH